LHSAIAKYVVIASAYLNASSLAYPFFDLFLLYSLARFAYQLDELYEGQELARVEELKPFASFQ